VRRVAVVASSVTSGPATSRPAATRGKTGVRRSRAPEARSGVPEASIDATVVGSSLQGVHHVDNVAELGAGPSGP